MQYFGSSIIDSSVIVQLKIQFYWKRSQTDMDKTENIKNRPVSLLACLTSLQNQIIHLRIISINSINSIVLRHVLVYNIVCEILRNSHAA